MWPKTDGRAGRDVEKLSRRSQRTHRKLGCQRTRDLVFREGILRYHIEVSPVSRCWCPIEAREALGGADVGEVVDEGAPDPFAGRKKNQGHQGHQCPLLLTTFRRWRGRNGRGRRGREQEKAHGLPVFVCFLKITDSIRTKKFMYWTKTSSVWGIHTFFESKKNTKAIKSHPKNTPQKIGISSNQAAGETRCEPLPGW